ncbi:DUF4198 domain-containing protein [Aliisedimentitalea scapharcae]|uniref:DUF4198 domain-containing protein n=1 Tax=Aliisedimentitalea scapharcae TaxID=1524259 RepID=A0ABZ2Y279_9RHOB
MRLCPFVFFCALCLIGPRLALAHEFWIAPWKYQAESTDSLAADFRNGEGFVGSELAYFDTQLQRADIMIGTSVTPYKGRLGDIPAMTFQPPQDGLLTVGVVTQPAQVKYKSWEKFVAFATHQDFRGLLDRHLSRGLPQVDFWESYTRYSKSLIAVGHGRGQDTDRGMETEFIALANPYRDDLNGTLPVRLLYQGMPRVDVQVEVFAKSAEGTVTTRMIRTDDQGIVTVPVQAGQEYLLNAVIVRPAPDDARPVWDTLWATLTFALPGD